jgi:hypothetical protein
MDLFDKSLESPIFEELCCQSWKILYCHLSFSDTEEELVENLISFDKEPDKKPSWVLFLPRLKKAKENCREISSLAVNFEDVIQDSKLIDKSYLANIILRIAGSHLNKAAVYEFGIHAIQKNEKDISLNFSSRYWDIQKDCINFLSVLRMNIEIITHSQTGSFQNPFRSE